MKKVLVTGSTGFIGSHILPILVKSGFEVHAVYNSKLPDSNTNYNWYKVNILKQNEIEKIFRDVKPEYLLHLAWETEHGLFWKSKENYNWVTASLNIVKQFELNGGKRVVAVGTCAEYEFQSEKFNEIITPIKPASVYGKCKYEFYSQLKTYCEDNDMSFAWGRIFYLYGQKENPKRLVPFVIKSMLQNQITKTTHGNQVRDYLHVEDAASAFVQLLNSNFSGAINIASGIPVKLNEIINTIATKIKRKDLLRIGEIPVNEDDPEFIVADVNRLKNELIWKPTFDLSSGLDKTIEWWKEKIFPVTETKINLRGEKYLC